MLTINNIRKGIMVNLEGEPYVVMSSQFSKKQQSRPVVRATLKHLRTGQNKEHTFMQADKIQEADIQHRTGQFLYQNAGQFVFMDTETYEQTELNSDAVGDAATFLIEGQEADILLFEGNPIGIDLPIKIKRTITETAPGVKGDSASNVMKEATIEGEVRVKVPLFIKTGDTIIIDTRDGSYVERATT